jgi:hypothetical protein
MVVFIDKDADVVNFDLPGSVTCARG